MREGQNIWKFARPHFHTYTPAFRGLSLSTGKERDPQVVVNTLGDFYDTHFSEPNFDPSNACHRRYLAIYTQIAYTPNIPLEQITYEEVIKEWKKFLPKKATDIIDGNRARRRRRQALDEAANSVNQRRLPPKPRILNAQEPSFLQNDDQNEVISGKTGGRQYNPYRNPYGYGTVQGTNYPYAGAGVGPYQYGYGQYGQSGQAIGHYGSYYNQNPGSYGYYSGYNSGSSYNRPGYYGSNYYPSGGGNYYGGYFWNAGQKQNINMFVVFISLLGSLVICLSL
ncbi:unnamed protein product [Rotaria sp. Silwood1]|nr:unnamed protein product [Rotaria sp. Silwood1]